MVNLVEVSMHTLMVTAIKYISTIATDIDECLTNNGGCFHNCTNTAVRYCCSCPDKFFLQPM